MMKMMMMWRQIRRGEDGRGKKNEASEHGAGNRPGVNLLLSTASSTR